jgi:hypothetical protein
MTLLIIIILFVLLFGGFSYGYGNGQYRGYTGPGVGVILFVLLILWLAGVIRL